MTTIYDLMSAQDRNKQIILNACTVLNKRSRKFDLDIKIGVREQIDNLLSYINLGCDCEDIVFFTMTEKQTAIDMIQRFENADPRFARKIKGRLLVMSKVEEILKN